MVVLIDDPVNEWSTKLLRSGLLYSLADVGGLVSPKPPSRVGSANNSRMCSPGGDCPVSAGMKREWIVFFPQVILVKVYFRSFSSQSVTYA